MNYSNDTQNDAHDDTPEDIVNNALERMKTGAVVKEERVSHMKIAATCAIVITALVAFLSYDFVYRQPISETTASGTTVITMKQARDGSYLVKGKVNNNRMNFVVDTGATIVTIPLHLARKMDLPLGRQFTTSTANGFGTGFEVYLDSVTIGDITLTNIQAGATDGLVGDEALLGMSFLKKVKLEQENGVMTITR